MAAIRRRSRVRRMVKWVGLVLCLLMLVISAINVWSSVHWHSRYHGLAKNRYVLEWSLSGGAIFVGAFSERVVRQAGWPRPGFKLTGPHDWVWRPSLMDHLASPTWLVGAVVPLWIPFVAVSMPTALLWWRDRRRIPPGHCRKCGYDLTGNVSGVCPECGERI